MMSLPFPTQILVLWHSDSQAMPPSTHPHFWVPPPSYALSFPEDWVPVLHPLVNLGDCNIRIKDLTDKLASPSFLVPHLNLFLHASSQPLPHTATCWTSSSPVPGPLRSPTLSTFPSLQLSYSTFTANILQTYLDIQPTTFLVFFFSHWLHHYNHSIASLQISSTPSPPPFCVIFPGKSPILTEPEYPPYNIHTISEYPRSHPSREHFGVGWGRGQEEITQPGWLVAF